MMNSMLSESDMRRVAIFRSFIPGMEFPPCLLQAADGADAVFAICAKSMSRIQFPQFAIPSVGDHERPEFQRCFS
jgi:hypothetical protein